MLIEFFLGLILLGVLVLLWRSFSSKSDSVQKLLEEKHRQMLMDINDSLNKQSDRFNKTVTDELTSTRDSLKVLQLSQQAFS